MADEDLELDLSGGDEGGGGGKTKLIIIIAVVLLLVIGAAAFFLLGGDDAEDKKTDTSEAVEEAPEEAGEADAVDGEPGTEPIFVDLKEAFTVNFPGRKTHYLQLKLSMVSKKQTVIDAIVYHTPVISNNLLLIIASQPFKKLKTSKGRKALRQVLLEEVRKVVKDNAKLEGVDNLYFTNFVLQ